MNISTPLKADIQNVVTVTIPIMRDVTSCQVVSVGRLVSLRSWSASSRDTEWSFQNVTLYYNVPFDFPCFCSSGIVLLCDFFIII